MRRTVAVFTGVAAAGVAAALLRRRKRPEPAAAPGIDPRAEELRRKLAQARETAAEEDELGAEVALDAVVEERPTREDQRDDVDEARRRIHEDARAAAEEMRRSETDASP